MLLLLLAPRAAPTTPGYINGALVVSDLWAPLNATGEADAIYWTEAELYEWIDEAAKRLARKLGLFVVYDTSLSTATGTKNYTLPTGHAGTIQCDIAGRMLRARNVQELEALDSAWTTAVNAKPKAFVEDTQGLTQLTLYPPPNLAENAKIIGLTMLTTLATISVSTAQFAAPQCIREYFTFSALAEARAKETNASMDEIAQWMRGLVDTYEDAMRQLWG